MITPKQIAIIFLPLLLTASGCNSYEGSPWEGKIQEIPGKIECELYDTGGEGISYHDTDSANNGSGNLNPANGSFLNEFRMHEGVDISYTKTGGTDDNPFNDIVPEMNKLYVGWTTPEEWIRYTVNIKETGMYAIGLMYTANGDGEIEVSAGEATTGAMKVMSTHKDADTLAWRQWHHWSKTDSLGFIRLRKGTQVITLKTISNGNMNYDYLEFNKND